MNSAGTAHGLLYVSIARQPIQTPVLMQEPLAFLGGACVGLFGLDLDDEPLRSWIDQAKAEAGVGECWPAAQLPYISPARELTLCTLLVQFTYQQAAQPTQPKLNSTGR